MADDENQNLPPNSAPNPQPHLTETLTILLALAAILFALGLNPSYFVKPPSANAASCECKLNNCPCLSPFYIFSVVATTSLSVVWFGLFVLSSRLQYRFGLGLVWATYWLALRGILAPQFYNPPVYFFNHFLTVILLFKLRFRNIWDHGIHVIADNCGRFWNYITGNY
ncbi:hypothetical protein DVH24_033791 [Malus domestica]|uniref:Uncharacterized protein n=1 Tax=Malus domestica TaxID=3750 RepID=A0A498HTP1_MALDO|nr:hypothetical protein DVH24_033791 [Malus domestica]